MWSVPDVLAIRQHSPDVSISHSRTKTTAPRAAALAPSSAVTGVLALSTLPAWTRLSRQNSCPRRMTGIATSVA